MGNDNELLSTDKAVWIFPFVEVTRAAVLFQTSTVLITKSRVPVRIKRKVSLGCEDR